MSDTQVVNLQINNEKPQNQYAPFPAMNCCGGERKASNEGNINKTDSSKNSAYQVKFPGQHHNVTFLGKESVSAVYNPFDHTDSELNSQYYVHPSKESARGRNLTNASHLDVEVSNPGTHSSIHIPQQPNLAPNHHYNDKAPAYYDLMKLELNDQANVETSMNEPSEDTMSEGSLIKKQHEISM